jgi:PKD repeat protein
MLLPILSEIADKVGIICHSELAIKDINRGWLLPIGNGQAKSVTELDWKAGFSFFALNGNERLTELDSGRARSILLQSVRPLSLFVVIRPEDVGADDSFSAERITQSLKTKIGANNLPISRVRLNAGMVKSSVISVQYGTAVWNELGINGEARLNLIAARFDFEVTIAGNQECFSNWVCEDGVVPPPPPPPFCADAGYVLEDTNGGVISSGAIPSGGSANIVAPNGVVSVEDSVGNVLHTVSVESAGSAVQPLADSSVTVFNSFGAVVDSGSVLAEGSGTFSVADSAVANSDNSYQVSLPATDALALPDQSIEVNNVVEGTIPSVGTIDINLSDGTNVITPTSVAVTGRVVDIELAAGATMAVDFVADKLVANIAEVITFTDLTNNSPTNWGWFFNGDGVSNLQNPTFSFPTLGFKNITLFAAKTGLGGFITKSNYIEIVFTGLLDLYPNAAAAYSLRLIRGTYTGSAIRVRRSSDNTEQDIGFVNGVLDTAALLAFVGANNGFVVTWYDQSGNGVNATQGTQANQPQIVSGGVLLTQNGEPAIVFDGVNDSLSLATGISTANLLTAFHVEKRAAVGDRSLYVGGDSLNASYFAWQFTDNIIYTRNRDGFSVSSAMPTAVQSLWTTLMPSSGTGAVVRKNSVNIPIARSSITAHTAPIDSIGKRSSDFSKTSAQEIVIYPADQTANFTGIETNIQTYYGI